MRTLILAIGGGNSKGLDWIFAGSGAEGGYQFERKIRGNGKDNGSNGLEKFNGLLNSIILTRRVPLEYSGPA